jgi:hypothetical protein
MLQSPLGDFYRWLARVGVIRKELDTIKPTFKQITQIFEVLGIEIPESMA